MREIKFRAWDNNQKKMVVVDHLTWGRGVDGLSEINEEMPKWFDLMQYTGLTDKSGKPIFEGDIYHQGDKNIRYKVIFVDDSFVGQQIGNLSFAGLSYWISKIEVIGNIYENPELIK